MVNSSQQALSQYPHAFLSQKSIKPGNSDKMPSFNSITRMIQEDLEQQQKLSMPFLQIYEQSRKSFEEQGYSYNTTCLMQAFSEELSTTYPTLKRASLLKSLSLFSTMLLLSEYEFVVWSCFCTPSHILPLVSDSEQNSIKSIMNHLINTAYFTKEQTSTSAEFKLVRIFFDTNFQVFQGRHTDWLLLNEPDLTDITPASICQRYRSLHSLFEHKLKRVYAKQPTQLNLGGIDYNKLTREIMQNAEKLQEQVAQRRFIRIARKLTTQSSDSNQSGERPKVGKRSFKDSLKSRHSEGDHQDKLLPMASITPTAILFKTTNTKMHLKLGKRKALTQLCRQLSISKSRSSDKSSQAPKQNEQYELTETLERAQKPDIEGSQPINVSPKRQPPQPALPTYVHYQESAQKRPTMHYNLSDSLMQQTINSRIFDMNTIINQLAEADNIPNLKNSNYVLSRHFPDLGTNQYPRSNSRLVFPTTSCAIFNDPKPLGFIQSTMQPSDKLMPQPSQTLLNQALFQHQLVANLQQQTVILPPEPKESFKNNSGILTKLDGAITHQKSNLQSNIASFIRSYSIQQQSSKLQNFIREQQYQPEPAQPSSSVGIDDLLMSSPKCQFQQQTKPHQNDWLLPQTSRTFGGAQVGLLSIAGLMNQRINAEEGNNQTTSGEVIAKKSKILQDLFSKHQSQK